MKKWTVVGIITMGLILSSSIAADDDDDDDDDDDNKKPRVVVIPLFDDRTGNAIEEDVISGVTFSNAGATGLTGTMPDNGSVNITPGNTAQTIPEGYHDGFGAVAGDADLAAGNIKGGVEIFGTTGTVIEATGDAAASQVLTGQAFSNSRAAGLAGTMANNGAVNLTPGTTAQIIAEGYHNGTGTVAGDTDLTAGNIKSGVEIFGTTGTVIEAAGDAAAGEVLSSKTFSNASATGLTGTMPNNGVVNLTPGTTAQTIAEGYHDGTGTVAGDADLTAGNIKSGVEIFGTTGTVIEATGDVAASQVLTGQTFSNSSASGLTGTMSDNGAVNITPSTAAQTIPEGYHDGTGTVAGDADLAAGNIKGGVEIFGTTGTVIEATGDAAASQVLTGRRFSNASAAGLTGIMPDNGAVNLAPGTAAQVIAKGYHDGTGTVAGDADLTAGNIKSGVEIFGATGTVIEATGDAAASQVLTGQTFSNSSASGLVGTMSDNGAVNITPSSAAQTIAEGYHDGTGTVAGDADLASGNIKSGVEIFGTTGTVIEATGDVAASQVLTGQTFCNSSAAGLTGTMPDNGAVNLTPGTAAQTIAEGYHDGTGTVAGDPDLVPCNIKSGVEIFGVVGTSGASCHCDDSPEPNVMVTFDDSGSMYWAFMPNMLQEHHSEKRATAANHNRVYYNPNIAYETPKDWNQVDFTNTPNFYNAWDDGYAKERGDSTCSVDLATSYKASWRYGDNCDASNDQFEYVSDTPEPAYYHVFYDNHPKGPQPLPPGCTADEEDNDCYIKVVVSAASGNETLFPGGDERQNFATWYSYYRRRILAAKAAVGRAFAALSGTSMRVGYGSINTGTSSIDGISTGTIQLGVRPFIGTDRQQFFSKLYSAEANGSTALRRAVDDVGQYFMRSDSLGPWSSTPGTSGGTDLECRKSYHVIVSDGYWNSEQASTAAARLNVDGTDGPNGYVAESPYSDLYSNTLADVAMYYWKNDLRTDLGDYVSPSEADPAEWQHLTTFAIGFGLEGTIDKETAFDAIGDDTVTINWPDPTDAEDPDRVDDMLHAAINGHGNFFSASDPSTLYQVVQDSLIDILAR